MVPDELIKAHRSRALTPDRPVLRGTAQNPDAFFQAREACNGFYDKCPETVQQTMDDFAKLIGRSYHLFDYVGHPEAERVIVLMGSGAETAHETIDWMLAKGEKVGIVKVRLYRPFPIRQFIAALPKSVKSIAVLDRTKEAGSIGEPLYLDILAALREAKDAGYAPFAKDPSVIGGRYGLSSKEFTPACVKAVFDELAKSAPKVHFTVGIVDDVTHLSLPVDPEFDIEPVDVVRGVFFGLGSDGTVGANKNSIKIIGEETDNHAQGYFVYDSKKAGAITISHLRFGPRKIRSAYLIKRANFVACHQFNFLDKYDMTGYAVPGGVFLLNAPFDKDAIWDQLPREVQQDLIEKKLKFYVIDAIKVAKDTGMGGRINTIMQTCFFAVSGVLPREEAIARIKETIKKTYEKKGMEVVQKNYAAVDETLANMHEVKVPAKVTATSGRPSIVSDAAPDFVKRVSAVMIEQKGDLLPVSAFPPDGTWPTATSQWEKRNIALDIPVWDETICIQCNKCALVCPHAAIRAKVYEPSHLEQRQACELQVDRLQGSRVQGDEVHDPGRPRGLHRLHPLRGDLSCQGQVESEAQGARHEAPDAAPRAGGRELRLLPRTAGSRPDEGQDRQQGLAVPAAALRVLGRMRRMRRDALREAPDPALRRPGADRQRDRLLIDLRRQPAHDALRGRPATAAVRPGRTRSSRTTRSSPSASGWRSTRTQRLGARSSEGPGREARRRAGRDS